MPPLGQIWRSFSMLSRTASQQGCLFQAPHAACATMPMAGGSVYVTVASTSRDGGGLKKTSLPRVATLQKQLLLIVQLVKFCQLASFALESTWSSSLSVFSSSLWPMTFSSINSTSLKANTLPASLPRHMQIAFLKKKSHGLGKCSKGTCGKSAVDEGCVCWEIEKFVVN